MVGVGNNYDNLASTFEIDAEDIRFAGNIGNIEVLGMTLLQRLVSLFLITNISISLIQQIHLHTKTKLEMYIIKVMVVIKRVSGVLPQVMVIAGLLAI